MLYCNKKYQYFNRIETEPSEELDEVSLAELNALRLNNQYLREKQKVLEGMQHKLEQNSRLMTSTTQVMQDYDNTLASRKKVFDLELESAEDIMQKRNEEGDMLKQIIRGQEEVIGKNNAELALLREELSKNEVELAALKVEQSEQVVSDDHEMEPDKKAGDNMSVLEEYIEHLSTAMQSFIGGVSGVIVTVVKIGIA